MDSIRLCELLKLKENEKIEFKSKMYELEGQGKGKQWNELIKDIISLANGNVGTANEDGYLIIGAADKINEDGTRDLFDVVQVTLTKKQLIDKLRNYCYNPVQNLDCDTVSIDGKTLFVITIHPSDFLHELKIHLSTKTQEFPKGTVLIRRPDGEEICQANDEERARIRTEKENRNIRQESTLYKKLTDYRYIEEEIKEDRLSDLIDEYSNALKPIHDISQEKQEILRLIQAALRNSIEVLSEDYSQLASQLLGRLLSYQTPEIQIILDRIRESKEEQRQSWLEPISSSLTPPIASLLDILEKRKLVQMALPLVR